MNAPNAVKSLDDIAGKNGTLSIITMDQRDTLRRMFTAVGREGTDEQLRQAKVDVARDPALDARWVLEQGGDPLKFFVQLRGDRPAPARGEPDLVAECVAVCQEIIDDCPREGIPAVIENLIYAMPGTELSAPERETAIIESARVLNDLDIDLLKLEYPGSPEACRRLASVLTRPWAVLSAGVPFDEFQDVLRIAFDEGGAAGFIAGRSVWREAVSLDGPARQDFLTNVAKPRLDKLVTVADNYAHPLR